MILLDSNVFIYGAKEIIDLSKIWEEAVAYASISVIETLGFRDITASENTVLTRLFTAYRQIDLSTTIISRAVELRQAKAMSLGDAIVAATALECNYELWTANTDDFKHIVGLHLHNPMA